MKKSLSLLVILALFLSMAACGGTAEPATDTEQSSVGNTTGPAQEMNTQQTEVTEETAPQAKYSEQVEENYRAIMNGEVTGQGAEIIRTQDEDTAKLLLECLTNIFGDDVLGGLQSCSGQELDQIMSEAFYMVSTLREQNAEEVYEEPAGAPVDGMGYTMVLYNDDLNSSIRIRLNPDQAFMEPDWTMLTDQPENYFIHMQSNYEVFSLHYSVLSESTQELINSWIKQDAAQGKKTAATKIETFTAGGVEWELFALVFDQTTTGIDKDTGKEVTLTSTVYDTTCFARLGNGGILQISTGLSVNPDVMEYYKNVVCTSIADIIADQGVG